MRRPELGFKAVETAPGTYKFQAVTTYPSRSGTPMVRTLFPHAHVLSEQTASQLGYDTRALIEQHQSQRVTIPGQEAARRREAMSQVTLDGIAKRQAHLDDEITYANDMIEATAQLWGERYGDPDAMYQGVYPNVVDQYRDFDIDPDRDANMFVRSDEYRLGKHKSRPEQRATHKAERQQHRRERQRNARRGWWTFGSEEG